MLVNPRPIFSPVDPSAGIPARGNRAQRYWNAAQSHGEINGFRLLRIDATDGGQTQVLHEDKSIPQSRGCPNGYSIGAVQTFEWNHSLTSLCSADRGAPIRLRGPDFRWIAVTGRW